MIWDVFFVAGTIGLIVFLNPFMLAAIVFETGDRRREALGGIAVGALISFVVWVVGLLGQLTKVSQ